jgi:hypothetical protein
LLLAVAAALLVGACGSSPESPSPAALASPSPLVLAGTVAGHANFATNPRGCVTGWTAVFDVRAEDLSLGPVTWHGEHCLDVATLRLTGEVTLTAADGSVLRGTYAGETDWKPGLPAGATVSTWATIAFNGGTLRYASAHGPGAFTATFTFPGPGVPIWPFILEWSGSLEL